MDEAGSLLEALEALDAQRNEMRPELAYARWESQADAGATMLGRATVGARAVVGGNVWLTESTAPGSVIHQAFAAQGRAGASPVPAGHVVEERDPLAPSGRI